MQSNDLSFEAAIDGRVQDMLDACTRCGKCVEACPSVKPAGIADAKPEDVISGILDILRTGSGPEASRQWAVSCMLSGECITACDEGVNPRFLLAMARISLAKAKHELPERRRQGLQKYREVSRDVSMLSQMQLDNEVLERLGQKIVSAVKRDSDALLLVLCLCRPHGVARIRRTGSVHARQLTQFADHRSFRLTHRSPRRLV